MTRTASTEPPGCQVKIISSLADLETVRSLWETTQRHPFADYDFFRLIVQARGNIVSPCVLVLVRDGEPVALLAGRIETAKMPVRFGYATLANIPVRQAVFVGGGFMGAQTMENWQHLLASMDDVIVEQQLDLVLLEQVRSDSWQSDAMKQAFSRGRLCPVHDVSEHWTLRLPETWDDFLKRRSKKHRYWLKRLSSVLDREFAGKWTIRRYTAATEAVEFEAAMEVVAQKTYHRNLGAGFSTNDESLRRMELESRRGQLQGYVLFIANEPKAFWYCFTYKQTLYLAATGYDPAYRDYELGTVLLMKVFQDHCGTDAGLVDFGLGDAGYKRRFGSEHFMEASFYIFPRTMRGAALISMHRATVFSAGLAKRFLKRLRFVQSLKTFWRRKLEGRTKVTGDFPPETLPDGSKRGPTVDSQQTKSANAHRDEEKSKETA